MRVAPIGAHRNSKSAGFGCGICFASGQQTYSGTTTSVLVRSIPGSHVNVFPLLLHLLGWLARFQQKRSTLDPNRYDAVFQRMWEYYLSCGIAAARASDAAVYQVLFHNDWSGDIPLKRVSRLAELA